MKKGLLPAGFRLRKVTEADLHIADYLTNNFSEASSYADIAYVEYLLRSSLEAPQSEYTTDAFIVIDPEGKAVGYAELYEYLEEDALRTH
jgi:hypothetical protein